MTGWPLLPLSQVVPHSLHWLSRALPWLVHQIDGLGLQLGYLADHWRPYQRTRFATERFELPAPDRLLGLESDLRLVHGQSPHLALGRARGKGSESEEETRHRMKSAMAVVDSSAAAAVDTAVMGSLRRRDWTE